MKKINESTKEQFLEEEFNKVMKKIDETRDLTNLCHCTYNFDSKQPCFVEDIKKLLEEHNFIIYDNIDKSIEISWYFDEGDLYFDDE